VSFSLAVAPRDTDSRAQVTVLPSSVPLEAGQTATVTVRLSGSQPAPGAYSGAVTIQGGNTNLRIPYLYMVGDNVGADLVPVVGGLGFAGVPGEKGILLSFKLIDRFGVPVSNAPVRFRVASGGGLIERGDATTDVFGIAAALVDLGPVIGEQQFSADAAGLTIDFYGRAQPPSPADANNAANRGNFAVVNRTNRGKAPPEPIRGSRVIPGVGLSGRQARVE
jgi:hypothetical protein